MQTAILWPAVTLVALIYGIWFFMYVRRFAHMRATPPRPEDFASGEAALRYFAPVEMPANNLRNLFEMPVLFFALLPLLLLTQTASGAQVALAWGYVVLRGVHSFIHIGRGPVVARFAVYAASCALLAAMWIGFTVDALIVAGR